MSLRCIIKEIEGQRFKFNRKIATECLHDRYLNRCEIFCKKCVSVCPVGAIKIIDGKAEIDKSRCIGCGRCASVCPKGAIIPEQIPAVNQNVNQPFSPPFQRPFFGGRMGRGMGRKGGRMGRGRGKGGGRGRW